ncbi:MAG: hypothetical protein O2960_15075 [Verrucomicrobia bacterium]|nr:hypothetical protein [Verrucomicrobiota bacterium]
MPQPTNESSLEARLETAEQRIAKLEANLSGVKSASIISILIPIIDYIRRDNLPEDRKILLSLKEGELRQVHGEEHEELLRPSRRACSAYDVLGILLREVAPEIRQVIFENWGDSIVACFNAAERSGILALERSSNRNRWKNFEQLSRNVEECCKTG